MARLLGLFRRYNSSGDYVWHIDKCIRNFGRLCETTGTSDRNEAERYLLHRIHQIREIGIYGSRPRQKLSNQDCKLRIGLKSSRGNRESATVSTNKETAGPKPSSLKYAAGKIGCSLPTLYELMAAGKLRSYHIGRAHRVSAQAISDCITLLEREEYERCANNRAGPGRAWRLPQIGELR